jgi:dihydroorotate dehydrogenase electron transfer subunit
VTRPVQTAAEVLAVKQIGAYHAMTVVASGFADTRPGQFVAVAVGGPDSALLLRRAFSIYRVQQRGGFGGTVEFIFSVTGVGTAWLAGRRPHDPIDVVGPLGRPFRLPRAPVNCLLVGGGYGSAPLFPLADALRARGCRVDVVLGASRADRLFGALEAKRMAATVAVTTEDGSYGERGRVTDVLAAALERGPAEVLYACGPMAMLAAVSAVGQDAGIPVQVAVEESMACGIGVCMTCVLPVVGDDGATRMVRCCVEGPVFRGERVRWAELGTVPPDAVGAPVRPPARSTAGGAAG